MAQLLVSFVSQLSSFIFLCHPEEILERLRAKKEEELEEVKRRAAAEAQKARLEQEKKEQEVGKEAEEAKLKDDGQLKKEEEGTKEEVTEEKKDDVKTGGDYDVYIRSIKKAQQNLYPKVEIMVALKHCEA